MHIKINNFFSTIIIDFLKLRIAIGKQQFFQNISGADHARDLICDVKAMEGSVNVDYQLKVLCCVIQ
jgi:hypothetical protein